MVRDAGWAEHVPSVTSGAVRPSSAMCHHPGRCGTIPSAVKPCSDGAPPHRALYRMGAPVSRTLELMHERRPGVNACRTTLEATPRRVQRPPRHLQEPGSIRTPVKSQALHTGTTILYKTPCGTSVSRLPSAYKKRRRLPGRRGRS
jgi:hypothetical protein